MMRAGSVVAGKYRLEQPLGEGAMGVVWAAVNTATERRVAIKVMASALAGSEEGRARLIREARACGRISHKNVIEVLDAGETDDGAPYIVMPLLVGETLEARIAREGPLAERTAAFVALEIARGLAAAHDAGIVHRDLKPGNVFLCREADTGEDAIKILDFGVSKILSTDDVAATATGSVLGSPAYMAPEQVRGVRDIDHRADLWAFGVVLFELLTGVRPFFGDTVYSIAGEILSGRIPDVRERAPSTDPRFAAIIASCLERDVQRRAASAGEIVESLRAILGIQVQAAASRPLVVYDDRTRVMEPRRRLGPSVTSTTPVLGGALAFRPHQSPSQMRAAAAVAIGLTSIIVVGAAAFFKVHRSSSPETIAPGGSVTVTRPATSVPLAVSITVQPVSVEDLPKPTAASAAMPAGAPRTVTPSRPVETHTPLTYPAPPAGTNATPKPKIKLPTDPG